VVFHLTIAKVALFSFSGDLTENSDIKKIVETAGRIQKEHPDLLLDFDLHAVSAGNSMGLLNFQRALKGIQQPIVFSRVPYWWLNYFNIATNFFEKREYFVRSVYVAYYSESKGEEIKVLKQIGTDIPIAKEAFKNLESSIKSGGHEFEPDFVPERVLRFLFSNLESFKSFSEKYQGRF
jgi:hypothetical protein